MSESVLVVTNPPIKPHLPGEAAVHKKQEEQQPQQTILIRHDAHHNEQNHLHLKSALANLYHEEARNDKILREEFPCVLLVDNDDDDCYRIWAEYSVFVFCSSPKKTHLVAFALVIPLRDVTDGERDKNSSSECECDDADNVIFLHLLWVLSRLRYHKLGSRMLDAIKERHEQIYLSSYESCRSYYIDKHGFSIVSDPECIQHIHQQAASVGRLRYTSLPEETETLLVWKKTASTTTALSPLP